MAKKTKTRRASPRAKPVPAVRPTSPEGFLGLQVSDKITEFKGTIVSILYMLSGCIQAHVTPKAGNDGKIGDGFLIDLERLDVLGAGPMISTPCDDTSHILLGVTALDKVTGAEGTLTEKSVHINGCTTFILTSKAIKKDERIILVDWKRLDLAGSRVVVSLPRQVGNKPPLGGPMRRVPHG